MVEKIGSTTLSTDLTFLPKQKINYTACKYISNKNLKIWVNNYQVKFSKEMKFLEFAVEITPSIGEDNKFLKEKLLKQISFHDLAHDNLYLITGDAIFIKTIPNKDYQEIYDYEILLRMNQMKYKVSLRNTKKSFDLISDYKLNLRPVHKMLFELLINQVVRNNPNIEVFRRMFIKSNEKKPIETNRNKLDFFPGFTTSINLSNEGIFLTVTTKNRFLSTKNCLELIKECKTPEEIVEKFVNRSVKTTYSKKNFIVNNVCLDKTPSNTIILYSGKEVNLVTYYKTAHSLDIKDKNQPLLEIQQRDGKCIHLIPELCLLAGIDDNVVKDRDFMKKLADYTKFEPQQRVKITQDFFPLLLEKACKTTKDSQGKVIKFPSPYETLQKIGLSLENKERFISGCTMKEPIFVSNNKILKYDGLDRTPVNKNCLNSTKKKLLVLYHYQNADDSFAFQDLLGKAGKAYGLATPEIEWAEIGSNNYKDWTQTVDYKNPDNFVMVVFMLNGRIEYLYDKLKVHSLSCNGKGYLSQVVKAENISGKRGMSVASKLLTQMNNKLGGSSYALAVEQSDYKGTDLMLVGVDSSHISGKRTGVALVATTSKDYSQVFSHEDIIEEKNKTQLVYSVGRFINNAFLEYFKVNKALPKGVVIFRQGVSAEQKEYLKEEVANIENYCKGIMKDSNNSNKSIPYYYVIVNKKTNFKFFESSQNKYNNPDTGLVIFDGATDGTKFDFFIQPQKVTQGTATPTYYHVAFGDLKIAELLPKLAYDLCSIYPNWPGPVRVPHVLKNAEKLAKMVSKSIKSELHEKLKNTPCYL